MTFIGPAAYLRGFGTTRFLSDATLGNGEQAVLALGIVALLDALEIERAILAGFDWGTRTAAIVAALWPDRCRGLPSVSGYLIGSHEAGRLPLPPAAELQWWYQYYFVTERGPGRVRHPPARLRQAHLADRLAEVALRRRHLRSQRGRLRQPRSRRDRDPQRPLAARPGRRRARRPGAEGAARPRAGDRRTHHHPGRRRQRRPPSGPQLPCQQVLRHLLAPDHRGRHRPQPSPGSPRGVRQRRHRVDPS
jgi:pimeloyl-ACP methyl ester carboxylesterase